jgi:uncharacterized membrane-anchored protein
VSYPQARTLLNKVPEVTIIFWVIKILSTTTGETAADYLNFNLGLGLTSTTYLMSALLVAALVAQFAVRRYIPAIYWLTVVLISIVGTLITDNLTDTAGVPLETTTVVFSIALIATFAFWYAVERTLSIRSIDTRRREAFYWLAILFTFALGTAAGDLLAEKLALGYAMALLVFAAAIAVIALTHFGVKRGAVISFWLVYILTRPLGASLGDLLSQDRDAGGLGMGATMTSLLFLVVIVVLVTYLSVKPRPAPLGQPAYQVAGPPLDNRYQR